MLLLAPGQAGARCAADTACEGASSRGCITAPPLAAAAPFREAPHLSFAALAGAIFGHPFGGATRPPAASGEPCGLIDLSSLGQSELAAMLAAVPARLAPLRPLQWQDQRTGGGFGLAPGFAAPSTVGVGARDPEISGTGYHLSTNAALANLWRDEGEIAGAPRGDIWTAAAGGTDSHRESGRLGFTLDIGHGGASPVFGSPAPGASGPADGANTATLSYGLAF